MPASPLLDRLERLVGEWASRETERSARRLRRELLARDSETSPLRAEAQLQLEMLLAQPSADRIAWIEVQQWGETGAYLGTLLLDEAEKLPLVDRMEFARLAARVSALSNVAGTPILESLIDDNLGRAGFLEIRMLRRFGELEAARTRFGEVTASMELEESPRAFWLTLTAERALTAGLLSLDEYRTSAAREHFERARRHFRVAGTEEDDAELLFASARLDLVQGQAEEGVDRLLRAGPFENPALQMSRLELLARAALRTKRPGVARPPVVALAVEGAQFPAATERLMIWKAAVAVLEGHHANALEHLAGPRSRLRAEGNLVGSLAAAVVACRAELALQRRSVARNTLKAGVLEHFVDLPQTSAVSESLSEITARLTAGAPDAAFLDRIDLWLILVEDSPGVGMQPQD